MSKIGEKVKSVVRNWLNIQPANNNSITIFEPMTFNGNVIKNQVWYRGDASELHQLYSQMDDGYVGRARFWTAAPARENIRKIHSGLPALMVDILSYIVKADLSDADFGKDPSGGKEKWESITEELDFAELIGNAIVGVLTTGDGAFKISVNKDVSDYPMVEFFSADRVDYEKSHGRISAINFYTDFYVNAKTYRLKETYQKGKVRYALYDGDNEVPLGMVPEVADLKPTDFDSDFIMAVPFKIYNSSKFPGRGKSIYDTKTDVLDAFDEVISQWMDALRAGRVHNYIPEDMIPRDPKTGALISVNSFGTDFIQVGAKMGETDANKGQIQTIQPEIRYDAFLSTYTATLDMCLQGIISPATLGIDLGKMASADAQREKKDITGHTRNTITDALEKVIPKLVAAILMTYDNMQGDTVGAYEPSITFGEYGAPDFDSRVDTINKAATAGTMSIETQVDELWGSSKEDKWKSTEVGRIKTMKGIEVVGGSPAVGDELNAVV